MSSPALNVVILILPALLALAPHSSGEASRLTSGGYSGRRGIYRSPFYGSFESSRKRNELPYHPLARFKGADTRPYSPPAPYTLPALIQQLTPADLDGDEKLSAGELLTLLTHAPELRNEYGSRLAGTMRFGIMKKKR